MKSLSEYPRPSLAPAGPRLNGARLNRHKVDYVVFLRAVLHEYAKQYRTPESLRAVEEIEHRLNGALGPSLA